SDMRDPDAIERACEGIDIVHHNVAQVPLAKDRHLFESVNVGGAENLLGACARRSVGKVVLVSSSAVFGVPPRNPVGDAVEPRPREAYGHAKLEAERVARRFVERERLDVTIVRPRTILGHGRLGVFQILFEWVRRGKPVWVLGRGDNRYQFVHADDLAEACIRAGELPGPDTFNVGAERFGTNARGARGTRAARGHRQPRALAPGAARDPGDGGDQRARPLAARRVPLAYVRPRDVLRPLARQGEAGLDAALVERRDVRTVIRLVRGAPRRGPRALRRLATPLAGQAGHLGAFGVPSLTGSSRCRHA